MACSKARACGLLAESLRSEPHQPLPTGPLTGDTGPPKSITSASPNVPAGGRGASSATQDLDDPTGKGSVKRTTGSQSLGSTPGQEAARTAAPAASSQAFRTKAHLISPPKLPTSQRRRLRANSEWMTVGPKYDVFL